MEINQSIVLATRKKLIAHDWISNAKANDLSNAVYVRSIIDDAIGGIQTLQQLAEMNGEPETMQILQDMSTELIYEYRWTFGW